MNTSKYQVEKNSKAFNIVIKNRVVSYTLCLLVFTEIEAKQLRLGQALWIF